MVAGIRRRAAEGGELGVVAEGGELGVAAESSELGHGGPRCWAASDVGEELRVAPGVVPLVLGVLLRFRCAAMAVLRFGAEPEAGEVMFWGQIIKRQSKPW